MDGQLPLFWRRSSTATLVALGALLGFLAAVPGLAQGLLVGYAEGIQRAETGQAQILSLTGPVKPYFFVKALAENLTGVEATSARVDFEAVLSAQGRTVPVRVRAFNFSQEAEVTNTVGTIVFRAPEVYSGFVLSRRLASDPFWAGLTSVNLSPSPTEALGRSVSVLGHVTLPGWAYSDDVCYIDLQTAQGLLGSPESVTSIALKLAPDVASEAWAGQNRQALEGFNLVLRPWTEVLPDRALVHRLWFGPLSALLPLAAMVAFAAVIVLGVRGRGPRSGLALWRSSPPHERWLPLLLSGVSAGVAFLVLWIPSQWMPAGWEPLLDASFPRPVGSLWAWNLGALLLPGAALAIALVAWLSRRVKS